MMKMIKKSITIMMVFVICILSLTASVESKEDEIVIFNHDDKLIIVYDSTGKYDILDELKEQKPEVTIICANRKDIDNYRCSEILEMLNRGDLDQDGEISLADATIALRGVLGIEELSGEQLEQLDLYSVGESRIGLEEVTDILNAALGLFWKDTSLPAA